MAGQENAAGAPGEAVWAEGLTTEGLATLERRAGWAMVLLVLFGCLAAAFSLLPPGAEVTGRRPPPSVQSLTGAAAFVATAVAFSLWLHRACACTQKLFPPSMASRFDPGAAVVSFFLPLANLWLPYVKVRRLSDALDPDALPEPAPAWAGHHHASGQPPPAPRARWPKTAPVGLWWAVWLFTTIFAPVSAQSGATKGPNATTVGVALSELLAAALAALVVRSITLRVREVARRRSVPLPPVPFYG
jgi:uncharacterized protein DUF4328